MPTVEGTVPFTTAPAYRLELPDAEPPSAGFPVLLALHGFSDDGARLRARLSGLFPAPYAVLLPDGPYPVVVRAADPPRVGRSWYSYTGDQAAFREALAVTGGHVERVLAAAAEAHRLDLSRVVVLGYSQGGYLGSWLALAHPERYRGLVSISCRVKVEVLGDGLARARGFPVLVLHGAKDEAVKLEPQRESVARLEEAGVDVTLDVHDGGHGLKRSLAPTIDAFVRRALDGGDGRLGE